MANADAERNIFGCGEIRLERGIVPEIRQVSVVLRIAGLNLIASPKQFERFRLEQAGQHPQQRSLTRPVGTQDLQTPTRRDVEREAPQEVTLTSKHVKIFYRQLRHLDDYLKTDWQQPRSRPSLPSAPTAQA
jgi:hypothetical protein